MRDKRSSVPEQEHEGGGGPRAAGKASRTERLGGGRQTPVDGAGRGKTGTAAAGGATASEAGQGRGPVDDPFGFHVVETGAAGAAAADDDECEHADDRGGPRGGGEQAAGEGGAVSPLVRFLPEVRQLLDQLDELIASAIWEAMRPDVVARASVMDREMAKARRADEVPDLTGMGTIASLDQLAGGMRALQSAWPRLSPRDRQEHMLRVANQALSTVDVPPIKDVEDSPRKARASFHFPTWNLLVRHDVVDPPGGAGLGDDEAAELTATTAHETRHAEEYFLAARFSAEQGADAATIAARHRFPLDVSEEAVRLKLEGAPGEVRKLAHEMHDSTVTNFARNAQIAGDYGYDELEARRVEAVRVRRLLAEQPSVDNRALAREAMARVRAAKEAVEAKYVAYRAIPHEADAHAVGQAGRLAFEEGGR